MIKELIILITSSLTRHDFARKHGGRNSKCNGEGLMSYGNVPDKWSTCSNSDFIAWWRREGYTCMKEVSEEGGEDEGKYL